MTDGREELSALIASMFRADETMARFMDGCAEELRRGILPPEDIAEELELTAKNLRDSKGRLKERLGLL